MKRFLNSKLMEFSKKLNYSSVYEMLLAYGIVPSVRPVDKRPINLLFDVFKSKKVEK